MGTATCAQQESVPVAAVADAWAQALREQPDAPLWTTDGNEAAGLASGDITVPGP
jgi:hypothetical protein